MSKENNNNQYDRSYKTHPNTKKQHHRPNTPVNNSTRFSPQSADMASQNTSNRGRGQRRGRGNPIGTQYYEPTKHATRSESPSDAVVGRGRVNSTSASRADLEDAIEKDEYRDLLIEEDKGLKEPICTTDAISTNVPTDHTKSKSKEEVKKNDMEGLPLKSPLSYDRRSSSPSAPQIDTAPLHRGDRSPTVHGITRLLVSQLIVCKCCVECVLGIFSESVTIYT